MAHRARNASPTLVVALTCAIALAIGLIPLLPLSEARHAGTAGAVTGPVRSRYLVPTSIDGTGRTDVTAAIQRFVNRVPHHAEIDFPPGRTYRIEGTLHVVRRNDFIVDGGGSTFFASQPGTSRTRSQWNFEDDSNLVVENMTIRGANPVGGRSDDAYVKRFEAQQGVNISGGERIDVHNLDIADTFGDFIYVSRSAAPVYGHPRDVHIHDNVMTNNGRMGITVADATGVTIDHNTLSETRRATIDLEPYASSLVVRNIAITDNQVNAGRLFFVAGHGMGDVSDVLVANNTLHGHSMGVDMAAISGRTRHNVSFVGNVSDFANASVRAAVMRFVGYDGVVVRDNVQPTPHNRAETMVVAVGSCNVDVTGNDVGIGSRQLDVSSPISCAAPSASTARTPGATNVFDGQHLVIDAGGASSGAITCFAVSACNGYLHDVGGNTTAMIAPAVPGAPALSDANATMLTGNMEFSVPIRSGTYRVTLAFVEPTFRAHGMRRINVDSERQRMLIAFDPVAHTDGPGRVVHRGFTVTVGDGTLDIFLGGGTVRAVVSSIVIDRM